MDDMWRWFIAGMVKAHSLHLLVVYIHKKHHIFSKNKRHLWNKKKLMVGRKHKFPNRSHH